MTMSVWNWILGGRRRCDKIVRWDDSPTTTFILFSSDIHSTFNYIIYLSNSLQSDC